MDEWFNDHNPKDITFKDSRRFDFRVKEKPKLNLIRVGSADEQLISISTPLQPPIVKSLRYLVDCDDQAIKIEDSG